MATTKTENGTAYPASAYAYVPDGKEPSTWKLRIKDFVDGKLVYDKGQLGAAAAALSPGGFRGNRVELPAKAVSAVKAKIRAGYKALGVKPDDMPPSVKQAELPDSVSMSDLAEDLCDALDAKYLTPEGACPTYAIRELYPDRMIVWGRDGELYQIPFTVAADEMITLGEPVAVEIQYVPEDDPIEQDSAAAQASATAGDVRMLQALDKEGRTWEVLIIQPGLGANGQYFPEATLRQAVPVFEGAKVFCLDDTQHSRTGDKSARQIVGWIDRAEYREAGAMQAGAPARRPGLYGRLHLLATADWLRQNLLDSHAQGKGDLYGLSVDAPRCKADVRPLKQADGTKTVQWFTQILPPATVDVVWNPGTPGGFQRALNAAVQPTTEEERMKERLLKLLQANRPDLYAKVNQAEVTEDQLLALLGEGLTPARQAATASLNDEDRAAIRQATVSSWNLRVAQAIFDSKLPEATQNRLRKWYMDKPGDFAAVEQAIKDEREYAAALQASGNVTGLGLAHDVNVEGEVERLQASMDKLLGVTNVKSDAPAFRSLKQAYIKITGDTELVGRISPGRERQVERVAQAIQAYWQNGIGEPGYENPGFVRMEQSQIAANWPTILGNSLYRRLIQDYNAVNYYEDSVITTRRRASDFRTLEAQRLAYAADLPTITPETIDYPEAATLGEEQINYVVGQRGNLITISRKTIMNDDLGAVQLIPKRFGRAARRTFARAVWNLLINNATWQPDGLALFHASHNNLGATALTADATGVTSTLPAALNRLAAQTEPGSGERLAGSWWGMKPQIFVPIQLQDVARRINASPGIPGTANNGDNAIYGLFGDAANPERIIVNPLFTDTNDWYLSRNPADGDMIEVSFLNGQETPELFVADMPNVGLMFQTDKLQYKIRFEFGVAALDYRFFDKSVV